MVGGNEDVISGIINLALDSGISGLELREVILTTYLFDGYPTALEGFRILAEYSETPEMDKSEFIYSPLNIDLWRQRGEPLCRRIYGSQYEQLMVRVERIAPELADAMMVEGYGKVLSRDKLETRVRELCIVAILAIKNKPRQLLSHSLGALRLGASPEQLRSVIGMVGSYVPKSHIDAAGKIVEEAISKYMLP